MNDHRRFAQEPSVTSEMTSAKSRKYSGLQIAALGFAVCISGVLIGFVCEYMDSEGHIPFAPFGAFALHLIAYGIVVIGMAIGFFGITAGWWSLFKRVLSACKTWLRSPASTRPSDPKN